MAADALDTLAEGDGDDLAESDAELDVPRDADDAGGPTSCRTVELLPPLDLGPVTERPPIDLLVAGSSGWLAASWGVIPGTETGLPACGYATTTFQVFALDAGLAEAGPLRTPDYCLPALGTDADPPHCYGFPRYGGRYGNVHGVPVGDDYVFVLERANSTGTVRGLQRFSPDGTPVSGLAEPAGPDDVPGWQWDAGYADMAASGSTLILGAYDGDAEPGSSVVWISRFDGDLAPLSFVGPLGSPPAPEPFTFAALAWDGTSFRGLVHLRPSAELGRFGALNLGPESTDWGFQELAAPWGAEDITFWVFAPAAQEDHAACLVGNADPVGEPGRPNLVWRLWSVLDDGRVLGSREAAMVGGAGQWAWDGTAFDILLNVVDSNLDCDSDACVPYSECPDSCFERSCWADFNACYLGIGPMTWVLHRFDVELNPLGAPIELARWEPTDAAGMPCDFVVTTLAAGHGMIAYPYYYFDVPTASFRGAIGRLRCTDDT